MFARLTALTLAASVVVAACANTMRVSASHDIRYDFDALHTYAWIEADEPRAQGHPIVERNQAMHDLIVERVDAELRRRGLTRGLTVEDPDALIDYHAIVETKTQSTTYREFHPTQGAEALASETTDTVQYARGTLVVHMIQASDDREIWRGIARDSVDDALDDPAVGREKIGRAITRMFDQFPRKPTSE